MHTIMVKNDNDVVAFGRNDYGQLGLGHNNVRDEPTLLIKGIFVQQIACGYIHTVILEENGDVLVTGHNLCGQLGLGHNHNQNKLIRLMGKLVK